MKYIKFAFINIMVFSILFFLLSLLFPNTIQISKSITIVAKKEKIYNTIYSVKDWKQWNEFHKGNDISTTITYHTTDTISTLWKQNNDKQLRCTFSFIKMGANSTAVNWTLQRSIKWYHPIDKFSALFIDKNIKQGMEISLNNLKNCIEK